MHRVCPSCFHASYDASFAVRDSLRSEGMARRKGRFLFLAAWDEFMWQLAKSEECTCMARPKKREDTQWKGFANVPFNAEERALYSSADLLETVVHAQLEEMLATGYRVSFFYDAKNDAAQCSVTCADPKSVNAGWTMTSRGPTWWDALSVAVFKHFILCEGVWPKDEATAGSQWG